MPDFDRSVGGDKSSGWSHALIASGALSPIILVSCLIPILPLCAGAREGRESALVPVRISREFYNAFYKERLLEPFP